MILVYVVSNVTWENSGSKLRNDFENQIVFETRDQHKEILHDVFLFSYKVSELRRIYGC